MLQQRQTKMRKGNASSKTIIRDASLLRDVADKRCLVVCKRVKSHSAWQWKKCQKRRGYRRWKTFVNSHILKTAQPSCLAKLTNTPNFAEVLEAFQMVLCIYGNPDCHAGQQALYHQHCLHQEVSEPLAYFYILMHSVVVTAPCLSRRLYRSWAVQEHSGGSCSLLGAWAPAVRGEPPGGGILRKHCVWSPSCCFDS